MRDSFPDISGGDSERDVRRRATERQRFKKRSRMKGVEDRIDKEGEGRREGTVQEEEGDGKKRTIQGQNKRGR